MSGSSNSVHVRVLAGTPLAGVTGPLASGAWGSLTTLGITEQMITRGDSDSIYSYTRNGVWDPVLNRIYFWGATHGSLQLKREIRYIETSNTWEVDHDGMPMADGEQEPSHGFHHFAIRPSDGRQYLRHYDSATVSTRMPGVTPWSTLASIPDTKFWNWGLSNALQWHPGINGGSGGLVFCGARSVYAHNNAIPGSWTRIHDQANLMGTEYGNVSALNRTDNCVYFGGTNNAFFRVNADGTVVPRANLPEVVGTDSTSQGCLFGGGSSGVFVMGSSGAVYEYNVGTNTWSGQISTRPFSAFEDRYFAVSLPDHGAVGFMYIVNAFQPSTTMHIFKR